MPQKFECACCHPDADQTMALEIAKQLMNLDPEARRGCLLFWSGWLPSDEERAMLYRTPLPWRTGTSAPIVLITVCRSFPTVPLSPRVNDVSSNYANKCCNIPSSGSEHLSGIISVKSACSSVVIVYNVVPL